MQTENLAGNSHGNFNVLLNTNQIKLPSLYYLLKNMINNEDGK